MSTVVVSGSFDDMKLPDVRFLQEAAKLGLLRVLLWSDALTQAVTGAAPKFPLAERQYFVSAMRYVTELTVIDGCKRAEALPAEHMVDVAAVAARSADTCAQQRELCRANDIDYRVIEEQTLLSIPEPEPSLPFTPGAKKVIVTGCFDWFHSGHVRFFEEAAEYGQLTVALGNDANLLRLKGPGHPMFSQQECRYLVGSVRFVHQAIISTGMGWMDAAPDIDRIKPDRYVVNEDGDKPEKREFCDQHGLEYIVLKRLPKDGLPRRQSTDLRGF